MLWDIMRYYEILWDIMKYYEILWDITRYYEILWDIMGYYEILRDIMRYYEILTTCNNSGDKKTGRFFFLLFSIPFAILSLLVVTQIRGHIAGSSSPPTHYGSCLAFLSREDFSSSCFARRLASNRAYPRSQQSITFCFLHMSSKPHDGGIGTPGPTL